jgi:hypothetical protein
LEACADYSTHQGPGVGGRNVEQVTVKRNAQFLYVKSAISNFSGYRTGNP